MLSHFESAAVPLAVPLSHSKNRVGQQVGQARTPSMTVFINLLSHSHPLLRFQPSRVRACALSVRARARLHTTPYRLESGTVGQVAVLRRHCRRALLSHLLFKSGTVGQGSGTCR
jgi:hypothetical protein